MTTGKTRDEIAEAYSSEPWWYDLRGFFILTFAYNSTIGTQMRFFGPNFGPDHLEVACGTGTLLEMVLNWPSAALPTIHKFRYSTPMRPSCRSPTTASTRQISPTQSTASRRSTARCGIFCVCSSQGGRWQQTSCCTQPDLHHCAGLRKKSTTGASARAFCTARSTWKSCAPKCWKQVTRFIRNLLPETHGMWWCVNLCRPTPTAAFFARKYAVGIFYSDV
jgi:hypothetical protein